MEKIRYLVLEEPMLYLLGALVSALLLVFGFSPQQATNIMFWWYVACATTIGLYMMFCSVLALLLEKNIAEETTPGWNLENRPSLQDLKTTDPEQARWMGEMYDMLDQMSWHGGVIYLVLTLSIFVSLALGGLFLRQFVIDMSWWKLALAVILLAYGFVMHSNKIKEVFFEKRTDSRIRAEEGRHD